MSAVKGFTFPEEKKEPSDDGMGTESVKSSDDEQRLLHVENRIQRTMIIRLNVEKAKTCQRFREKELALRLLE